MKFNSFVKIFFKLNLLTSLVALTSVKMPYLVELVVVPKLINITLSKLIGKS